MPRARATIPGAVTSVTLLLFGALDALAPGETMRFRNDHDPIPLLRQLQDRYGDSVQITYVQTAPGEVVIDFAKVGG